MADVTDSGGAQFDGFVSYSRSDAAVAAALVQAAEAQGRTLWLDTAELAPATTWRDELRRAIESADAVVCLLSAAWTTSPECLRELELAVQYGKRLIPVRVEPLSWTALPGEARSVQWIDATTTPVEEVARRVISAIDRDHERVQEHTRWLERAVGWDEGGHDRSLLARGRDLRAAEAWLAAAGDDPRPTPLQIEFVSSSRRSERRRGRLLLSGVSIAAVLALVLAGVAIWQRSEAVDQRREAVDQRREAVKQRNTAEARRLAAESQRLAVESKSALATDPEIALILASDGYRASPTAQATTALRQALGASLIRSTVESTDRIADLAPAASGLLVTAGHGQGHTLAARRGADVVSTLDTGATASTVLVNADGTAGVALTNKGAVGWRLDSDTLVETARVSRVQAAAMSSSGDRWVVLDSHHRLWTYDGAGGLRSEPLAPLRYADMLALSADGSAVAVSNGGRLRVRLPTGSYSSIIRAPGAAELHVSADGQYVIALNGAGRGEVIRTEDGSLVENLTDALSATVGTGSEVAFEGDTGIDIDWLGTKTDVHIPRDQLQSSAGMTKAELLDSDMAWTDDSGLTLDSTGDRLLTYDYYGVPHVWDAHDGHLLGQLPTSRGSTLAGLWFALVATPS
jgi:hypothetical protein